MATKKTTTSDNQTKLLELRLKYREMKLKIAAGKEKNTNAASVFKKQIAQLLTQLNKK